MTAPSQETIDAYEFRQVANQDLGRYSEMARLCFALELDDRYFKWKYFENPSGPVIAYEALHRGEVAAFYGAIPETFLVNGKAIRIYQSMDTMTHPNHWGRGLFTGLARITYKQIRNQEGHLRLIGIAGPNSFHGFVKKLGWKNIHNFRYLALHRSLAARGNLSGERYASEPLDAMDSDAEDFLRRRNQTIGKITNLLSPEYVKWKVFGHPIKGQRMLKITRDGRVAGLCVYSIDGKGRCFVYLLVGEHQQDLVPLARATARELFAATNASFIYTWEPLSPDLHLAFRKARFLPNPFPRGPFSYRVPLIVQSDVPRVEGLDWYEPHNYDIQCLMQD